MIPGIESLYQRIVDAMTGTIPEEWVSAEFHAMFHAHGSIYEAEYVRADGIARNFAPAGDGGRTIRELRQLFKQAGQPVWGQVWFLLRSNGSFNARWGYDGCDANGDLPFDEKTEVRRHDDRRLRLIAGKPRQA